MSEFYFNFIILLSINKCLNPINIALVCRARQLISFCFTRLKVFLEGRGSRDGLASILVILGIRVTGISHTSGTTVMVEEKHGERNNYT